MMFSPAELEATALDWGMDVLAEVHNEAELERALRLATPAHRHQQPRSPYFLDQSRRNRTPGPQVPGDRLIVGESGLFTPADLARLAKVGVNAFLIGESLMRQDDVASATRAILDQAMTRLTHLDDRGAARMVDVSAKGRDCPQRHRQADRRA